MIMVNGFWCKQGYHRDSMLSLSLLFMWKLWHTNLSAYIYLFFNFFFHVRVTELTQTQMSIFSFCSVFTLFTILIFHIYRALKHPKFLLSWSLHPFSSPSTLRKRHHDIWYPCKVNVILTLNKTDICVNFLLHIFSEIRNTLFSVFNFYYHLLNRKNIQKNSKHLCWTKRTQLVEKII